jgi:hypothetical protein
MRLKITLFPTLGVPTKTSFVFLFLNAGCGGLLLLAVLRRSSSVCLSICFLLRFIETNCQAAAPGAGYNIDNDNRYQQLSPSLLHRTRSCGK